MQSGAADLSGDPHGYVIWRLTGDSAGYLGVTEQPCDPHGDATW